MGTEIQLFVDVCGSHLQNSFIYYDCVDPSRHVNDATNAVTSVHIVEPIIDF